MKFSVIESCPFCGSKEFFSKCFVKGFVFYKQRYDGEEVDNESMYESAHHHPRAGAYCSQCKAYIGNIETDTLGKAAERALKRKTTDRNTFKNFEELEK